jgi:MFS family permease
MSWRNRLPPPLRGRDYALLWITTLVTGVSTQMIAVAVGWQVYAIHHNPLDIGLIGLAEFLPLPLLALPAGQLSDRVSRRRVIAVSIVLDAAIVLLLLGVTLAGAHRLWPFIVLAAAAGSSSALGWPALRALPPVLVPMELLPSAMALRSTSFQVATVLGPAIGGLLFAASAAGVYAVAAALFVVAFACVLTMRVPPVDVQEAEPLGRKSFLAGIRFVRRTPMVLGSISLDLFAVFFGDAIALAPLFAHAVLHTGPFGLGLLRSAPAVGAVTAGIWLTHRPLQGRAGRTLLVAVAGFGACMIVFGLSQSFALSATALAVAGFFDMFSMNIRSTTVAIATPDALRGRVLAIEMVFISASNELGAFESGVAASILGATTAVVAGGAVTVGLAASWLRLFPSLANVDRLEDVAAAEAV